MSVAATTTTNGVDGETQLWLSSTEISYRFQTCTFTPLKPANMVLVTSRQNLFLTLNPGGLSGEIDQCIMRVWEHFPKAQEETKVHWEFVAH